MENAKSKYNSCLAFSVSALSRMMTKMANEEFAGAGLTSSYAYLLMIVNEQPGIHAGEVGEKMYLSPSTITRLIEKMENRWLLERKTEGKVTKVYPTQNSLDLDDGLREAWSNLYRRYTSIIGDLEANELIDSIFKATLKLV